MPFRGLNLYNGNFAVKYILIFSRDYIVCASSPENFLTPAAALNPPRVIALCFGDFRRARIDFSFTAGVNFGTIL